MEPENKANFFAVSLTLTGESALKTHHRSSIPISDKHLPTFFTRTSRQRTLKHLATTLRQALNSAEMEEPGSSTSLVVVSANGQPSTPAKSTPKKRKIEDPTYVPIKNEYSSDDGDDEHDGLGLHTPKRTPRKRKVIADPNDTTRSTGNMPSHTPKRKKIVENPVLPSPSYTPASNTLDAGQGSLDADDMISNPEFFSAQFEDGGVGDNANYTRRALSESATDLYSPGAATESGDSHETAADDGPHSPLDLVMSAKKGKKEEEDDALAFMPHHSDEEKEEDNTFRISRNEKTAVIFDFSVEKARRWAEAINLPEGVYNDEESDLFFRLAMRGFEPLVPRHWKYDFPTLPGLLFPSPEDEPDTLIQALEGSNFYGVKSLYQLFSLGGRVRDCRILKTRPEATIMRHVKRYIRWAIYDSKLHIDQSAIPVYTIYAQKKGESTLSAVKKLNQRLQVLANRYQESLNNSHFGPPSSPPISDGGSHSSNFHSRYPLLVGFVVCGPIIAILTLSTDPSNRDETTDSKFISQFDLSERGQDVWNSLAVAIAVMHIRKTMVQLATEKLGGYSKLRWGSSPISDNDL